MKNVYLLKLAKQELIREREQITLYKIVSRIKTINKFASVYPTLYKLLLKNKQISRKTKSIYSKRGIKI